MKPTGLYAVCWYIPGTNSSPIKKERPSMKSRVLMAQNLTLLRLGTLSVLASTNIKRKWRNLNSNHTHGPTRKSSVAEQHKSAITDHVVLTNHNIKWDAAKVIDSESDKTTIWVKEAILIRRKGNDIFDQLFHTTPSTAAFSSYKRTMLSGQGCQSEEAASLAVKSN